jgi:hypothetical protein
MGESKGMAGRRIIALIIFTLIFVTLVKGQQAGSQISIQYLEPDGSMKSLQRLVVGLSGRAVSRNSTAFELRGQNAPLKLSKDEPLNFVAELPAAFDPSKIQLIRLSQGQGRRLLIVGTGKAFGGLAVKQTGNIPLNVSGSDDSSFKFTPSQNLPAGEYAFLIDNSNEVFCFGVSEK